MKNLKTFKEFKIKKEIDNMWNDKYEVKLGDYGEWLVDTELIRRGYTIYKPITDNSHPFDRIVYSCYKSSLCNHDGFVLEVKTKPRRLMHYDTGIDVRLYNHYKEIEERNNYKVFLIFVDPIEKTIYGNWLSELSKDDMGYPKKEFTKNRKMIIYFDLNKMKKWKNLTDDECENLKKYSTSKYW